MHRLHSSSDLSDRVTTPSATSLRRFEPFTLAQMQGLLEGGTIDRQMLEGRHALGKKFPELASELYVNARRR